MFLLARLYCWIDWVRNKRDCFEYSWKLVLINWIRGLCIFIMSTRNCLCTFSYLVLSWYITAIQPWKTIKGTIFLNKQILFVIFYGNFFYAHFICIFFMCILHHFPLRIVEYINSYLLVAGFTVMLSYLCVLISKLNHKNLIAMLLVRMRRANYEERTNIP